MVLELNSEDFAQKILNDEAENRTLFVLVDFFATWCGPCRMLGPILNEIDKEIANESHELHGKISIAKVDIDQSSDIAQDYQIMSVPTIVIFEGNEEVHRVAGFISKEELMRVLLYVVNEKTKR